MAKDLVKEIEKQIVHTTSIFAKDEGFSDDRFCRCRVAVMHSGINRNGSRFSKECIEAAKNTFANIPVLADVREYEDKDGNKYLDYAGHTMHIEEDAFDDSKDRIIYDEKVVGIVPETNNFELTFDEASGNYYAWVDALLYRDYGNYVCDILESRGGSTEVSMEISCSDISFNAKDRCLDVGEMTACGFTLLGEHVAPGMKGAHATMFSLDESDRQTQLIKIMQELKETLDNYTKSAAQENQRKEDADVDHEEMLEVTETLEEEVEVTESTEEVTVTEEVSEESAEETPEVVVVEEEIEVEVELEAEVEEEQEGQIEFTREELFQKLFELSHNEVEYALWNLLSVYRNDDEWCYLYDVYDEYIIMQDYNTGNFYKQTYGVDGDNVALTGERIRLFQMFLTESEKIALEDMRSNYASIQEQLKDYQIKEENAQKDALFQSEDYSSIFEKDEFKALVENHAEFSLDELKNKLDAIILDYAKKGNLSFATVEQRVAKKELSVDTKNNKGRYGNLKFN